MVPLHNHQGGYNTNSNKESSIGEGVQNLEPWYTAGGKGNGAVTTNTIWRLVNKINRITKWSIDSPPSYTPQRIESRFSNKYSYMNMYIFLNGQKVETTQMCLECERSVTRSHDEARSADM